MVVDKKALFEAVKEPLRLLVLAVLPFAVTYFARLSYQWAVVIVLLLRGLDKYLHVARSDSLGEKANGRSLGLVGF